MPYQIQVDLKKAAVVQAEMDLDTARRGAPLEAKARSERWIMEAATFNVLSQVANLRSRYASLVLAQENLAQGLELAKGGISKEDLDQRKQAVEQALQAVYASRASLDLSIQPPPGRDLTYVPPDLDQTYPGVPARLWPTWCNR